MYEIDAHMFYNLLTNTVFINLNFCDVSSATAAFKEVTDFRSL